MKSIKGKITLPMSILVLVVTLTVGILSIKTACSALDKEVAVNMNIISLQAEKIVNSRIKNQKDIIEALALREDIKDQNKSIEEKFQILQPYIEKYGYMKVGITDLDGNIVYSNGTSQNISDREYFKKSKNGEVSVSEPLISGTEHILVVVYMSPIKVNDNIVGFLSATMDGNDISSISDDIRFGDTGRVFMLKKDGTKIAHYDKDLVSAQDNDLDDSEEKTKSDRLIALEKKMVNGEEGTGEFEENGVEKYMSYVPVEDTSWSLAVTVDKDEVFSQINSLTKLIILVIIICEVIAVFMVDIIAKKISNRVKTATEYILPMAEGDFTTEIDEKHMMSKDETGEMIKAVKVMKESIRDMLKVILNNSQSIYNDSYRLNSNSKEMRDSSNSVTNAIKEVASGTTVQAEDLVNITETLEDFSKNFDGIVQAILKVDNGSKQINDLIKDSKEKFSTFSRYLTNITKEFSKFTNRMEEVSNSIIRINEITDIINSISEQTNLLALNAAIEAARAGEAGKGFAVVAEEIRDLSEQSKKSAQDINDLINNVSDKNSTIISVTRDVGKDFRKQNQIVEIIIKSFNVMLESLEDAMLQIFNISKATEKINKEKQIIVQKVESTTAISEETSAAAEEILASSTEIKNSSENVSLASNTLKDKTEEMIEQVNKFKI